MQQQQQPQKLRQLRFPMIAPTITLACLTLMSALPLQAKADEPPKPQVVSQAVGMDRSYKVPADLPTDLPPGQEGLDILAEQRDQLLAWAAVMPRDSAKPGYGTQIWLRIQKFNNAMDAFAHQRYGHVSRLYWYTDLAAAKAQAKKTNRPILSLRMLGNLTDEYSCANSRFFRVMLYADPMINNYLRENFVLHWQSVRDVPQVTVTLADGSTMRRTVTGNSIHMVLTQDGQAVDVIPGLWHPKAFLEQLELGHDLVTKIQQVAVEKDWTKTRANQLLIIRAAHETKKTKTALAYGERLTSLNMKPEDLRGRASTFLSAPKANAKPLLRPAENAMPLAGTKMVVEFGLMQPIRLVNVQMMWQQMNLPKWKVFADSYKNEAVLSDTAWSLIAAENGGDAEPFRETLTTSLASDSAFNRFSLKQQIHALFASGREINLTNDARLTQTIYRDVLGMDLSDRWAGLSDPAVYTGMSNGGMGVNQP